MCVMSSSSPFHRIVTGNNTNNKSESDQEDNDDVNDNDWSYGAEKKGNALVSLLGDAFNDFKLILLLLLFLKMNVNLLQLRKGNLIK